MTTTAPVPFTITLATALGLVSGQLAVDRGPLRLAGLVPLAQQLTSIVCDRACQGEAQRGRVVSCHKGCDWCCYQAVPIAPPEAWFLADLVASLPRARRAEVQERFAKVSMTLAERGLSRALLTELSRGPSDTAAIGEVAERYFELGLACPFLQDGACSIHPRRPLVCREYSVTSPAAWCAEPSRHALVHVPVPASQVGLLARLTAELCTMPPQVIPLGLALDWAERHAEPNERSWPGVELFERYAVAFRSGGQTT